MTEQMSDEGLAEIRAWDEALHRVDRDTLAYGACLHRRRLLAEVDCLRALCCKLEHGPFLNPIRVDLENAKLRAQVARLWTTLLAVSGWVDWTGTGKDGGNLSWLHERVDAALAETAQKADRGRE